MALTYSDHLEFWVSAIVDLSFIPFVFSETINKDKKLTNKVNTDVKGTPTLFHYYIVNIYFTRKRHHQPIKA